MKVTENYVPLEGGMMPEKDMLADIRRETAGKSPHVNQLRLRYKHGGSFDEDQEDDSVSDKLEKQKSVFEARLGRVHFF